MILSAIKQAQYHLTSTIIAKDSLFFVHVIYLQLTCTAISARQLQKTIMHEWANYADNGARGGIGVV